MELTPCNVWRPDQSLMKEDYTLRKQHTFQSTILYSHTRPQRITTTGYTENPIYNHHTFHMYPQSFTKLLIPFFISTSTCLKTCSFSSSRFQSAFPTVLRLRNAKFWTSVFSVCEVHCYSTTFHSLDVQQNPIKERRHVSPTKKLYIKWFIEHKT